MILQLTERSNEAQRPRDTTSKTKKQAYEKIDLDSSETLPHFAQDESTNNISVNCQVRTQSELNHLSKNFVDISAIQEATSISKFGKPKGS